MGRARGWVACALVIGGLGCGTSDAGAPPAPPPPPGYEVHEWGFIGARTPEAGGPTQSMVGGAGRFGAQDPMQALHELMGDQIGENFGFGGLGLRGGKPVLYVHLAPGTDEVTFTATVSLPPSSGAGARFAEHFPISEVTRGDGGERLRWIGVRAVRVGGVNARYPTATSPECQQRADAYCEAAELASYETSDGAFLHFGTATYDHLFYRADLGATLPLSVSIANGRVSLAHGGGGAIPGHVLRISRDDHTAARTLVRVMDPPAPGASAEVAAPEPAEAAAARGVAVLSEDLRALGMTQPEVDAFLVAWREMLFGREDGAVAATPVQVGVAPHALQPKCESIVYFLPQAVVDRTVPLAFEPAPRAVRRAILVQIELPAAAPDGTILAHGGGGGPARVARVSLSRPQVRGSLSGEVIRRVMQRHINEPRFCYEQALNTEPPPSGRVHAEIIIGETGAVQRVQLEDVSLETPRVLACIEQSIRRWTFPTPEGGGVVIVGVDFTLEPGPVGE